MNLESEELNMEKIPEWIYAPTNFSPELEKTFAAVEKALGFKLFIWQKTFIANTTYRRSGRTTAEIRHKEWQKTWAYGTVATAGNTGIFLFGFADEPI